MKIKDYSVRILNSKNNPAQETSEGYVFLEDKEQYTLVLRNFSNDTDALASISIDGKQIAHIKVPAKEKVLIDTNTTSDKKFTFYKFSESGKDIASGISKNDRGSVRVQFLPVPKTFKWEPITISETIYYVPIFYPYIIRYPHIIQPYPIFPTFPQITWTVSDVNVCNTSSDSNGYSATASSSSYTINSGDSYSQVSYCSSSNIEQASSGVTGLSGIADYVPENVEESLEEFKKNYDPDLVVTIRLRIVCKDQKEEVPEVLSGYGNPDPKPID